MRTFSTTHTVIASDSAKMGEAVFADLVVTSPPYPMIGMWDEQFAARDSRIGEKLAEGDGPGAFELMHRVLDPVWAECFRVLRPGGFACVNIGDATRTVDGVFRLYSNHSRILSKLLELGFSGLPNILWRKPTNAPNKFMGSGMLPAGAYVTLEHEYILIVRKGGKRKFGAEDDRKRRQRSAIFWEERNVWFSDVWTDIRGTTQDMGVGGTRKRSGAFPFDLPYRLVAMYSAENDTVLDPFLGTGTTSMAALTLGRNSVGYETDPHLASSASDNIMRFAQSEFVPRYQQNRLQRHAQFIDNRRKDGKPVKHVNKPYGFGVVTRQETDLVLQCINSISPAKNSALQAVHEPCAPLVI